MEHHSHAIKQREYDDGNEELRPSHHHRHREKPRRRASNGTSKAKGTGSSRLLGSEYLRVLGKRELSHEVGFVQKWLSQTDKNAGMEVLQNPHSPSDDLTVPLNLQPNFGNMMHEIVHHGDMGPRSKRKKLLCSSDSSLLETPPTPKPASNAIDNVAVGEGLRSSDHVSSMQKLQNSCGRDGFALPIVSALRGEVFEKRARHRTKENRYEPKDRKKRKNTDAERRSRPKGQDSREGKTTARNSGEELMRNFSSAHIGLDRITVRPPNGIGLFNNGKASSSEKKHGLPDLAFSEMDFLQSSKNRQAASSNEAIASRSRETERRKATQAEDEISTFFKPSMPGLLRSNPIVTKRKLPVVLDDRVFRERQELFKYETMGPGRGDRAYRQSKLRETPQSSHSDQRTPNACRGQDMSPGPSPSEITQDTVSSLSNEATSYVSWSATQMSLRGTPMARTLHNYENENSPLPESVRKSLEKTGVFEDTGIVPRLQRCLNPSRSPRIGARTRLRSGSVTPLADNEISSSDTPDPMHTAQLLHHKRSETSQQSLESLKQRGERLLENPGDTVERCSGACHNPIAKSREVTGPGQPAIETNDQHVGWHAARMLKERDDRTLSPKQSDLQSPKLTREQLASNARLKRLPVKNHDWEVKQGQPQIEKSTVFEVGSGSPRDVSTPTQMSSHELTDMDFSKGPVQSVHPCKPTIRGVDFGASMKLHPHGSALRSDIVGVCSMQNIPSEDRPGVFSADEQMKLLLAPPEYEIEREGWSTEPFFAWESKHNLCSSAEGPLMYVRQQSPFPSPLISTQHCRSVLSSRSQSNFSRAVNKAFDPQPKSVCLHSFLAYDHDFNISVQNSSPTIEVGPLRHHQTEQVATVRTGQYKQDPYVEKLYPQETIETQPCKQKPHHDHLEPPRRSTTSLAAITGHMEQRRSAEHDQQTVNGSGTQVHALDRGDLADTVDGSMYTREGFVLGQYGIGQHIYGIWNDLQGNPAQDQLLGTQQGFREDNDQVKTGVQGFWWPQRQY